MHRINYVGCFVLFLLFCGIATAGTIYTWTDADGVKQYSNSQPPDDAQNVQAVEEVDAGQEEVDAGQKDEDLQRQEFDRMAEEAGKEADQHFEEQAEKNAKEAEAERQRQLEPQNRRVEEELKALRKEAVDIQNRGLGLTYSAGMKENQLKLVQEKIDLLQSDPESYFKQ